MRGREIKWNILSDKEKGYLMGLFSGDGYKCHDKKSRHYHIEFHLNSENDKKIINFISSILKKIGVTIQFYQDKRYPYKRVRTYSKNLYKVVEKNPNFENKNKDFKIGFISGFIDADGYFSKEKSFIQIVNTNKKVLDKCKKFLSSIGINSSISKRKTTGKEKLTSYRMYISMMFKNITNSIKITSPNQ